MMIFHVLVLPFLLRATVIPANASVPLQSRKDAVVKDLQREFSLAIAINDATSVKILLSLSKTIPDMVTKTKFLAAVHSGTDKLVQTLLKDPKASTWVSEENHWLISEAHRIGRSVSVLMEMLKTSNLASFTLGSISSSSSDSAAEEDYDGDKYKMVKIAELAGLPDVSETISSGNNSTTFNSGSLSTVDNSRELIEKLWGFFNDAIKNQDVEVLKLIRSCTALHCQIRNAIVQVISSTNSEMIEAMCAISTYNITDHGFEAAQIAAMNELPFPVMSMLFRNGDYRTPVKKLTILECLTVCVANELVIALKHLSQYFKPHVPPYDLESLTSPAGLDVIGSKLVQWIDFSMTKSRPIELLQILFDENRPFVKDISINLKMRKYQDIIRNAHTSGLVELRDQLLILALKAYASLPSDFDCTHFIPLAIILRGCRSLLELARMDPALNQDILRLFLNNLFNLAFAE